MQREGRSISRGGRRRALAAGGALALALAGTGTAFAAPTNPIAANEWALNYLNVTQVRNQYNAHGAGVIVAVIDTGVDPNQPDLQGRLVDGVNLVDPEAPTSDYADTDSDSHGTAVATVVAGHPHSVSGGGYYGMIGMADDADVMPIKAGINGSTSDAAIEAGIRYAVNHGASVINISQGSAASDPTLTSAIDFALQHGVVVVVSAGNDAKAGNQANAMATVPGVLDVGGIDSNGQKYSFGHYGPDVNIAAPANDIEVGLANGQYNSNSSSGTSLAAPWVAGEAALLIAEHPTWTSGQIVATIIDNTMQVAEHTTSPGQRVDDNVGYGVIDPVAALGASEPANTANPLGGPAITSNPAQNLKNAGSSSASPGATGGTGTNGNPPSASSKSSSKAPLIIGVVVVVVVLVALLIFLLSRRSRGGKGGPGGGGGGGNSNGYYTPPNQPGGQYAVPPQQQNPYQQNNPNPYTQPQQQPGGYPPPQGGGGGYGQQQYPNTGR
jgi:subtilisin family serine protease